MVVRPLREMKTGSNLEDEGRSFRKEKEVNKSRPSHLEVIEGLFTHVTSLKKLLNVLTFIEVRLN